MHELDHRGHFQKSAHDAAVDRRQTLVADEPVAESHQRARLAVLLRNRDADEARVRNVGDELVNGHDVSSGMRSSIVSMTAGGNRLAPSMYVDRKVANGSSRSSWYAAPRTNATLRVKR